MTQFQRAIKRVERIITKYGETVEFAVKIVSRKLSVNDRKALQAHFKSSVNVQKAPYFN